MTNTKLQNILDKISELTKQKIELEIKLSELNSEKYRMIWDCELYEDISELEKILQKQTNADQIVDYVILWFSDGDYEHVYTGIEGSYSLHLDEENKIFLRDNFFGEKGHRGHENKKIVGFSDLKLTRYYEND